MYDPEPVQIRPLFIFCVLLLSTALVGVAAFFAAVPAPLTGPEPPPARIVLEVP